MTAVLAFGAGVALLLLELRYEVGISAVMRPRIRRYRKGFEDRLHEGGQIVLRGAPWVEGVSISDIGQRFDAMCQRMAADELVDAGLLVERDVYNTASGHWFATYEVTPEGAAIYRLLHCVSRSTPGS